MKRQFGLERVAALLIAGCTILAAGTAASEAVVRQLSGKVEIGRGTPPVWAVLATGETVAANDRIRTGPDGRVELALDAGTLRVHENSMLTLPPASAGVDRVELELGHSLFDVLRREGRRFEVKTPTVVVSVKGTRFGIESGEGPSRVSVYRGTVGVRASRAGEVVETLVREGFLAAGGGDGPIELGVLGDGDPWSAWQDFQGGAIRPAAPTEAPETELERARTSLRRSTDVDVLKRAAERRPEIAERLREQAGKDEPAPDETDESSVEAEDRKPMPASPGVLDATTGDGSDEVKGHGLPRDASDGRDGPIGRDEIPRLDGKDSTHDGADLIRLDDTIRQMEPLDESRGGDDVRLPMDGTIDPKDRQRDVVDMERASTSLAEMADSVDIEVITGGDGLSNGSTRFSTDHLAEYGAQELMMLRVAMQQLREDSLASARPWSQLDMVQYLETQLMHRGVDAETAASMVTGLFR